MLDYLSIEGGTKVSGTVRVSGAKNSALPLLFATILSSGKCTLENVPDLEDISVTIRLLQSLGAKVDFLGNKLTTTLTEIKKTEARYDLVKAMRASFWVLGPLLARAGKARVALPGGDAIGTRPVDLHLEGLKQFGAEVYLQNGIVIVNAPGKLQPADISLGFPSVGATHHLLMTAALIPGKTIIRGAAKEPEVVELADFINRMGAKVVGAGTDTIEVFGKEKLDGANHSVLGDRIEAATYAVAAAVTGGKVRITGISPKALEATINVLGQAGCKIISSSNSIDISGPEKLSAISFDTAPYPGIATDVQPLLMAAMTKVQGQGVVNELVFENRFGHVAEYRRFGAKIELAGRRAVVTGVDKLSGAPVEGMDIRAAAGLVVMGLMADGLTTLSGVHHLDRGYEGLVEKLKSLGVRISRIPQLHEKELVIGC